METHFMKLRRTVRVLMLLPEAVWNSAEFKLTATQNKNSASSVYMLKSYDLF
uniref:Uncharacterized protein n=1 Tax=Anguilla anguilla TaxID=7936 RepID=A0A0E9UHG5_ANGAN